MIFRSNLSAPDLFPAFAPRVICKPRHNSLGHDVLSDSSDELEAGFLTHDEAAILYNVAKSFPGQWVDIGCRAGWSTLYIAGGPFPTHYVFAIDPELPRFSEHFWENMPQHPELGPGQKWNPGCCFPWPADEFFNGSERFGMKGAHSGPDGNPLHLSGAMIDGDHSYPEPLNDAKNAVAHLAQRGVIVLHDVIGGSIQDAVVWLLDNGFKARIYWTPHVMAVCWRGEFTPPDHVADPQIEPKLRPQMAGFPFERCC